MSGMRCKSMGLLIENIDFHFLKNNPISLKKEIENKIILLEKEIKSILREPESHKIKLKYAYQPIFYIDSFVNIYSYRPYAYESLLRNTEFYNMSIFSFLNFFIKEKKSFALHLYLFHLALSNFPRIRENSDNLLFFNLSPEIFAEDEFNFEDFYALLFYHSFSPEKTVFEITEKYSPEVFDYIREKIKYSKTTCSFQCVKFAVDDFGTGMNNGMLFFELKPDFIKVDRYFVQEKERFAYLKSIVDSFKELTEIVVEGVETEEEFERCMDLNINLFQGYFFEKPVIPAE